MEVKKDILQRIQCKKSSSHRIKSINWTNMTLKNKRILKIKAKMDKKLGLI